MHEILVNRLGGLSLPRKSVVRLTDRPDMTLDVYRGRKATIQQLFCFIAAVDYPPITILSMALTNDLYNDSTPSTFFFSCILSPSHHASRGWSGVAKVLGNFQCRGGGSYNFDNSRARAYCACSTCGWGLFGHFYFHLSFLFSFSLCLGDGPI